MTRWEFEQEHGWEEPRRRRIPRWVDEPPAWEDEEEDETEATEGGRT